MNKLTHQDCIDLKEAGFPFKEKYSCNSCGFIRTNRSNWCDVGCGRDNPGMTKIGDKPLLEELIEKCRNKINPFVLEENLIPPSNDKKWHAALTGFIGAFGAFDIQAVKNLYIALNKRVID